VQSTGPQPLRLVTSNLLHGRSLDDGQVDIARMVSSLAALDAQVIAMQEVDRFQQRSHGADLVAEIAGAIPQAQWRFVPAIMGVPGEQWRPATDADPASGHDLPSPTPTQPAYGSGFLTTLPVHSWHVIRVRPFRFRAPVFVPGINKWTMIDDEPRVCIAAVVEHEGRSMTIAGTHASFVPGWNIPQLRQITAALRRLPAPRILLGDLNLPSPLPAKAVGWTALASGLPTFPSPYPKMQLDHALLDDPAERLSGRVHATTHHLPFSDHRALMVDIG
jgi:endonuclease/exonuclease/phosphatase family metal-dependent hydrolase